MGARLQQLRDQLVAVFLSLPPARRVAVVGVGLLSMAAVLGLAWWVQRPLYRPLFTNLSEPDAAAIVEALRAEKVAFQLADGGRAVLVPADRLYELRLSLASRGLPEGGGVGFELFDRQTLGQTDFLQRLNYQRAMQGELGRTIAQLGGVESARVHLAMPERSLFVAEDRRPSASVVVKLAAGRTLSRAQIDGIVHLVASSVEGLVPDAVTVVDEGGRILTPERRGDEAAGSSSHALEMQRAVERELAERVESMLGAVVGREKAIARVTATLDFARVERTEESYDPDRTALRSQRTTREETVGARGPTGTPGVQANLTNETGVAPEGEGPRSERRDENSTYEVSKVVSRTIAPVGALKQLSVAVLIDGTYTVGEGGTRTFTARPQEELDRLRELVKSAVGFSEARGDKIEVASVAFQPEPLPAGEGILASLGRWAPAVLLRVVGVVFAALMLLYVVRPLLLELATRVSGAGARPGSGRPELTGPAQATAQLTQENAALAQQHPERAAQLVREWLNEPTRDLVSGREGQRA
jgi:flagellar M-ring protein FliF